MNKNALYVASLAVCLSLVAGAGQPQAPAKTPRENGKLLIIGGGITPKNSDRIYARLIEAIPPNGTIGVVPTASELEDSGSSSVKKISGYAGAGRTVFEIPVRVKDGAQKVDDPEVAEMIAKCDGVFFVGGAQSRVVNTFRPGGRHTKASDALDAVLAKGGILSGSSAGAAIMSDPMIYGGTSARALDPKPTTEPADPDEAGGTGAVPMGLGMGYFPYGTVDQHFLERGRLGRLIVAMENQNQLLGWGIPEDRAMLVDLSTATFEVIGDTGTVQVDRTHAKTVPNGRENIRLSLLSSGDKVNARTGAITTSRPVLMAKSIIDTDGLKGPWERRRVNEMVKKLSEGATTISAADENWKLVLSRDADTHFHGTPDAMSAIGIKLDLVKVK